MVATYLLKCEVIIVVLMVSLTCTDAVVPMNKGGKKIVVLLHNSIVNSFRE